jgi:hypothetical protein
MLSDRRLLARGVRPPLAVFEPGSGSLGPRVNPGPQVKGPPVMVSATNSTIAASPA